MFVYVCVGLRVCVVAGVSVWKRMRICASPAVSFFCWFSSVHVWHFELWACVCVRLGADVCVHIFVAACCFEVL